MLESIGICLVLFVAVCLIGRVFRPYHTYSSGSDHIGLPNVRSMDSLPDLRLAHWSPEERKEHLARLRRKAEKQAMIEMHKLEKRLWEEAYERRRRNYLARREAAWKNGTPDVPTEEVPEMRHTRGVRPVPRMPRQSASYETQIHSDYEDLW